MKNARNFCFLILSAVLGIHAEDTIELTNGDRLSGTIVLTESGTMTLKNPLLGEVKIPWDSISSLQSSGDLIVTDSGGRKLQGTLRLEGGRFEVRTQGGPEAVAPPQIATIRSPQAQAAYEQDQARLADPGFFEFWGGSFDAGLALTKGNSETTTFTTAFRAQRLTPGRKITAYANSVNASTSTGDISETTANAIRGGLRLDVDLSPRSFYFGFTDLEFDEFQDLDLRTVVGGGLGWKLAKSDRTTFDVFAGASFNQEYFDENPNRRAAEGVFGEELTIKLGESTQLSEKFSFFLNLSESGEYRLQFDSSLASQFNDWLAWHFTLSDRFLSNPPGGIEKNDVLLSTGVRVKFGK